MSPAPSRDPSPVKPLAWLVPTALTRASRASPRVRSIVGRQQCGSGPLRSVSTERPRPPGPRRRALLLPVPRTVAVAAEGMPAGSSPLCLLVNACRCHSRVPRGTCMSQPILAPGRWHLSGKLSTQPSDSIAASHLVVAQKTHFSPKSDSLHHLQSILLPYCWKLAGENSTQSKWFIRFRKASFTQWDKTDQKA